MESIRHRTLELNGIEVHVAEAGEEGKPVVLFLHGFPELWYSWRHQIVGLAARGYHSVSPDLRGYGDTAAPPSVSSYTAFHLVGDVVALIEALGQSKVFVVGHDWGALVAWYLCLFRPEKVKALVNLSVQYFPRTPSRPLDVLRTLYGDDLYICRFQEEGAEEADLATVDISLLFRKLLTSRDPGPNFVPKMADFFKVPPPDTLPSWLSEEDVAYYAETFKKAGFTGGINYYRCMNLNWELTAPWAGSQITVPTKFIVGDLDLTYHFAGTKEYLNSGGFKKDVPLLEVVVIEGAGHFINQERPEEITNHIYEFIKL